MASLSSCAIARSCAPIRSSLIDAAIAIEFLHEWPFAAYRAFHSMQLGPRGYWRIPGDPWPLLFSLRGRRVARSEVGPAPSRHAVADDLFENRSAVISGLHHVQLAMPSGRETEAEAFYSGLFRIPRVAKPANLERRGGCWFRSATVEIHLGVQEPFVPAKKAHPALLVDDLADLRRRLLAAGHPVVVDELLDGFERFYTSDPFGNRIEGLDARPAGA